MASGAWANACDLQAKFCNATFPQRGADGTPPNPLAGMTVYASHFLVDFSITSLPGISPATSFVLP